MDSSSFRALFHFSRKERIGILVIVVVLLLLYLLPEIFIDKGPDHVHPRGEPTLTVIPLEELGQDPGRSFSKSSHRVSGREVGNKPVLFAFDPNTLDAEGFMRLGLRPSTIKIILNFRNRGGRFYAPEDLRKVYGLKADEFERLQGYVHISDTILKQPLFVRDSGFKRRDYPKVTIDINQADSAMWDALPGIGLVLSSRIIRYREKLGGFLDPSQLREVYGISDSVFALILPRLHSARTPLRRISLNTEQESVLSAHPYIGRALAREMVAYRSAHGPFRDTATLYLLMSKPADQIQRIFPYLTLESK